MLQDIDKLIDMLFGILSGMSLDTIDILSGMSLDTFDRPFGMVHYKDILHLGMNVDKHLDKLSRRPVDRPVDRPFDRSFHIFGHPDMLLGMTYYRDVDNHHNQEVKQE